MALAPQPEVLTVEPRSVDRRLLLVLGVGVLVVALVLGGLAAADRLRGGASSPTALADRVVSALDREDLGALVRLVEPSERTALVRLADAWTHRIDALDLPTAVDGGPTGSGAHALDGLDLDLTGATPRVEAETGDVAVVDLGDLAVRTRITPDAAHGLLRAWFGYVQLEQPRDVTYRGTTLPSLGTLPRLVGVERSGRWYLSVLATLLGPTVSEGNRPDVSVLTPTPSPTPSAAVEATLRALLDGRAPSDVAALVRTLDPSGADAVQLWSSAVATTGLDRSPGPVTVSTTAEAPDGDRAVVRVSSLTAGRRSEVVLAGPCLTVSGERSCLHASGYRYNGTFGTLGTLELLGHDGAYSLTALHGRDGWTTSLPESAADALVAYGDSLTREQVLMVLGRERLDVPGGTLEPDVAADVVFTSGGYAVRTVHVARAGLYRLVPSTAGTNQASLYSPDGEPAVQPFFPNDSVYRLGAGDHTLVVWADDGFAATLARPAPYGQRVEVRSVR